MSQDQQTYTRATTASLIGFATQLLLTVMLGVLGAYAGSKAIIAGTFYLVPGLWIWVLLWMLYKQHRLERDEALEAARLADADARSAALFEEAGHQLAQAKRRLENLYKWALPLVSLLTAVYLLAVGGLLFYLNNNALQSESLVAAPIKEDVNTSLLALLLVIAWMAGFLVSRYVAGMTRVDAWQALRGGASTLIGHVFLGVLPLLVATALLFFGNDAGFVYLAIALPVVMILLGVEILLGLVLGFYRPRKAGVFYRPAFDSRLLGWLTRPESIGKIFSETINYQFGFEVSKSWFMRLLGKALLPLAIVCVAVIVAMTSVVVVEPHQQAVVTRNGAFVRIAEPGLSFKAPWPFGEAEKYDVNRVHSIRLGSRAHLEDEHAMAGPILWTNPHVQEGETEELLITAPSRVVSEASDQDNVLGEMIGADIDVKYRIADLRQYAGIDNHKQGTTEPVKLLESIAQHEVTRYFATHDTDTLMSAGRAAAGEEIHAAIEAELQAFNTGLEVVFVSVSGVHPPQDVAEDYHARINALQEQQTAIENARQEAESILAGLAGSRERADQLAALIDAYKELEIEKQRLAPADEARAAEIEEQLNQQRAAIEQMMSGSGGTIGQRLAEARALRWTLSMQEQARYIQRGTDDEAYRAAPRYFIVSRYLDTLVSAMADRPKTIFAPAPDDEEPGVIIEHPLGGSPGLNLP